MTRYTLDTTGDGERDNPKAFMREDPEGAWVLTAEEIEAFRAELSGFPDRAIEDQVDVDYLKRLLATLDAARHSGLEQALDLLEHPEHPRNDNTPAFWEGWHAALAAVRVALEAQQREGAGE